jgi:hypothetical protein
MCDILDIKCILVNELIGNAALALILAAIGYFIIASKMKLGFDTTLVLSVPILLGFASVIIGFSAIFSIITIIAGTLLALGFSRLIGNR